MTRKVGGRTKTGPLRRMEPALPAVGFSVPVAATPNAGWLLVPQHIPTKGQPASSCPGSRGLAQKEPTTMTRPIRACFTHTIGGALAARLHVRERRAA